MVRSTTNCKRTSRAFLSPLHIASAAHLTSSPPSYLRTVNALDNLARDLDEIETLIADLERRIDLIAHLERRCDNLLKEDSANEKK